MSQILFLVYANDKDNKLEQLTEEEEGVSALLLERLVKGDFIVCPEPNATPEKINRMLPGMGNQVAIFQYSGHAGGDFLQTEKGLTYARGLAEQLRSSVENGTLKLVILNGCSTYRHARIFRDCGVPVIISTSAPVRDNSAKEFSIAFWRSIMNNASINEAFENGLSAAKVVSADPSLLKAQKRHLADDGAQEAEDNPVWSLDYINENDIHTSPLEAPAPRAVTPAIPNKELLQTLFVSLAEAGNSEIAELVDKHRKGQMVTESKKRDAILGSLPYPLGVHLQKLMCPTGDRDDGFDSFGLNRLMQIGQLFQTTTEFFGIIMIAQVWETSLKYPDFTLTDEYKTLLKNYIALSEPDREIYDYKPMIKGLWSYLMQYETVNTPLQEFIRKLSVLKDFDFFTGSFSEAWDALHHIRLNTYKKKINKDKSVEICMEAERKLCIFLKALGFIHSYDLTSVQNIDVLKLRHMQQDRVVYKHNIAKCMNASSRDNLIYYIKNFFVDSWGVLLLKSDNSAKNESGLKWDVTVNEYLSLSPFIIDKNLHNSDKSSELSLVDLVLFKGEITNNIVFKDIGYPLDRSLDLRVDIHSVCEEEKRDSVREQYMAFKSFIA
jgi:hypothetical protein